MALLKGVTTYKADKDIKAGEEVKIETEFEADQATLDQLAVERINREKTKHTKEVDQLKKDLEAAKAGGGGDVAALTGQIKALQDENAEGKKEKLLNAGLRRAKALDLEDEFLPTISADDDEAAVDTKVKAAIKRRADLQKAWGAPNKAMGRVGNGASEDEQPEEKKLNDLMAELERTRPDLKIYVNRLQDRGAQIKLIESYKAQGLLKAKS